MTSAPRGESRFAIRFDPVFIAIIAVAAGVRFFALGAQSLWFDELVTTEVVARSPIDVLRQVAEREGSPPLYYMLLWGWDKLFGSGDAAVRSVSALAGIALVAVVYAIVRELWMTRRVARVAALLAAVNPMLVWYSQEARAYSLFALLGGLSILCFARSLKHGTRTDYLLWVLASGAAISTHYFALLLIAGETVWLLIAERRHWRRPLAAGAAVGVVALALLPLAIRQRSTNQQAWIEGLALDFRLRAAGRHLLVGPAAADGRLWVAAAILSALALVLLILRGDATQRSAGGMMTALFGIVAIPPLLAAIAGADYFLERNLIVVLVPLTVLLAAGFGAPRAGPAGAGAALGLCAVFTATVVQVPMQASLQKADWRAISSIVEETEGGSVIVVNMEGYLGLPILRYTEDARELEATELVSAIEIDIVSLAPSTSRAPCSWWFGRACVFSRLGQDIPGPLADRFRIVERRRAGQLLVSRYVATEPVSVSPRMLVEPRRLESALVVWRPAP